MTIGERFDVRAYWAEDEDGLSVIDKPPGGRKTQFALVVGKELVLRRFGGSRWATKRR